MVGWGGVLINPEGKIVYQYSLSFGKKTNNQDGAYGFLYGLTISHQRRIKAMNIFGNSLLIIKHMVKNNATQNNNLNQILERIKGFHLLFEKVHFFHILRRLKQEADMQENIAFQIKEIHNQVNRNEGYLPIPWP